VSGNPRIRALVHRLRQRLRAAADGALPRATRRRVPPARLRLPLPADDVRRRPDDD
jgi:hypothetical protein